MLLIIHHLSKSYGDNSVLQDVSLMLDSGQRVGLVGANGVGKSTLLKLAAGEIEADGGTVTLSPGAQLGYLPQTLTVPAGWTIRDLLDGALSHLRALEAHLRDLESRMASANVNLDAIMADYGEALDRFERLGGYEIDLRVERVLTGLGVAHLSDTRQVATLSGGEQARLGLAMLLLQAPDVLLLDEPTNHLDAAALSWLEDYLAAYRGALLIVSHDRTFLNRTANAIIEIDKHSHAAARYSGDYDAYVRAKVLARRQWEDDYARQRDEIKTLRMEMNTTARRVGYHHVVEGDKFLRFHKKTCVERTVSRRLNSAEEKLRRIEADPIPEPPQPLRFEPDFDPQNLKTPWPLTVSGLSKRYGSRCVLRDVGFSIGKRSRIVITGPNGAGKTTLLRLLAGLETPDSGEVMVNPQVRIGYLEQGQVTVPPSLTVLDVYRADLPGEEQHHIADLLASGLFRYEDLRHPADRLSSGQQRKLQIARLMAERANLLMLDEPTNFVSFDVLEALEAALHDFPGAIIAVSHDRRFIERFGGEIWTLDNARLGLPVVTANPPISSMSE